MVSEMTMYPSGTDQEYKFPEAWDTNLMNDMTSISTSKTSANPTPVIGVIGYGVVGEAVALGFAERGFQVWVNDIVPIVNPPLHITVSDKMTLMTRCDFIFICVNTPYKRNQIDMHNIYTVLEELYLLISKIDTAPIIIIKSTVIPGTTDDMQKMFPKFMFAVNPEFLREKHALADFLRPDRVVIGAYNNTVAFYVAELYEVFVDRSKIHVLRPKEAELVKYLSNAFLTVKVAFSVAVDTLCEIMGADADYVMRVVTKDHRIHPSHLTPSMGQMSADSPCLPKDLLSFRDFVEDMGLDVSFFNMVYQMAVNNG